MRKSKEEIISELRGMFTAASETCAAVKPTVFHESKAGKWSPAENFQHLLTATKMTRIAFWLPKFVPLLLYGKPARTSHSYSKVVDNYQRKLEEGAKARGLYIPQKKDYRQHELQAQLNRAGEKLLRTIADQWEEEQLDHYQVAHPILGLLTMRELAYFTIYHHGHHLETIRKQYL